MSWFGSSTATGPNIHPVQTTFSDPNALFGPLKVKDLEWNCGGGINTETQVRPSCPPLVPERSDD